MDTFAQNVKAPQPNISSKSTMPIQSQSGESPAVNSILHLQRTIGNKALQRLLKKEAEERNAVFNDTAHNAVHYPEFANIPVLTPKPISVQPKRNETTISQPPEPPGTQDIVLNSELPDREQALAVTLDGTIQVSPDASLLSKSGLDLLIAHESVHVAQQGLPGRPGTRSELEHEANDLAPLALAGEPFRPLVPASPGTALRNQETIGTGAADQQAWVRRIDTIVRQRFGLASVRGSMTDPGRVEFQDVTAFARGFGARPQDLLNEAFAENLGDLIPRIKDFYHLYVNVESPEELARLRQFVNEHISSGFRYWNYHALDWTDYGLTGITLPPPYSSLERETESSTMVTASLMADVTQAQAQAAVRRRPGVRYEVADGRSWPADPQQTQIVNFYVQAPLTRVTNQISAGEILADTYGGVTTGGARGTRRIRIRSTPGRPEQPAAGGRPATPAVLARPANVSTLVHEACHFYTHNNFNQFVDSVRNAGTIHHTPNTLTSISPTRLAPILEEGFTEYFTRMLMQEQHGVLGEAGTGYQWQYEAAHLIISSMDRPSAAESAYFRGDAASIRMVRDGIQHVEQYPNTARVLGGVGLDETEEALESVRTPTRRVPTGNDRMRPRTPEDVRQR